MKLKDLKIRDPFIVKETNLYYIYLNQKNPNGKIAVVCYTSSDLIEIEGPFEVLSPLNLESPCDIFFAPEVHKYLNSYYLITSYKKSENENDIIHIYKSNSLLGPFKDLSNGITPLGMDSIDGTLYVENGEPWLVFSDCFTGRTDLMGEIKAAKLSYDLSHLISTPITLFKANSSSYTDDRVAEAPFLLKYKNDLYMVWSNYMNHYYIIGAAKSSNGTIEGKWEHQKEPLYAKGMRPNWKYDGGHPMIFEDNGQYKIVFHSPNGLFIPENDNDRFIKETLLIKTLHIENGELSIE